MQTAPATAAIQKNPPFWNSQRVAQKKKDVGTAEKVGPLKVVHSAAAVRWTAAFFRL